MNEEYITWEDLKANCPLIEIETNEEQFDTVMNMLSKR